MSYLGSTDAELLGDVVHQIFFENKDLNLLFVLLASASGIANAFHLMTLFDEDFRYFDFTSLTNMPKFLSLGTFHLYYQTILQITEKKWRLEESTYEDQLPKSMQLMFGFETSIPY